MTVDSEGRTDSWSASANAKNMYKNSIHNWSSQSKWESGSRRWLEAQPSLTHFNYYYANAPMYVQILLLIRAEYVSQCNNWVRLMIYSLQRLVDRWRVEQFGSADVAFPRRFLITFFRSPEKHARNDANHVSQFFNNECFQLRREPPTRKKHKSMTIVEWITGVHSRSGEWKTSTVWRGLDMMIERLDGWRLERDKLLVEIELSEAITQFFE